MWKTTSPPLLVCPAVLRMALNVTSHLNENHWNSLWAVKVPADFSRIGCEQRRRGD